MKAMNSNCQHQWQHLQTVQEFKRSGYGSFHRRDIYHCIHCAELKVTEQVKEMEAGASRFHCIPEWWTETMV